MDESPPTLSYKSINLKKTETGGQVAFLRK